MKPRFDSSNFSISLIRRRYYWIFTLFFLLFGSLVAIVTSLINYNIQYTNIESELREKITVEKTVKYALLKEFMQHAENVVGAIANSDLTIKYVTTNSQNAHDNLNQLLLAATVSNDSFMQLRFIDSSGMESVRIDRIKGADTPAIVAENELQNKKDRYYFDEAARLSKGMYWHSNLDLNIEHGQIEMPIRPTFRIATPVFSDDQFSGFIVANISIESLLSALSASSDFDIYIIDKEGEFILHPSAEFSWSRYLPNRSNVLTQFPEFGDSILEVTDSHQADLFTFSINEIFMNDDEAFVMAVPRQSLLAKFQKDNMLTAYLTALTVLIVSFILSGLVAIIPARLQNKLSDAYFKIKNYAEIINRYVITSSTDKAGHILSTSAALSEVYGFSAEELKAKKHNIVKHFDTATETHEVIWNTILKGKTWRGEIKVKNKDGNSFWLNHVITPDFDDNRNIVGFTSISHDITDKKEIERLSVTDTLTGLNNRRRLDDLFSQEYDRFNRYKRQFSMILLDIDHFKQVNDKYGHKIGDKVLIEMGEVLASNVRKNDLVGRWGGEEFLLICPETTIDGAIKLAEKIRLLIEKTEFTEVKKVTSSFGVTVAVKGDSDENMFIRADNALYKAKSNGRNCVVSSA
ncbi:diguanylate cyclase [Shewanella eurypsychrophilus]|uniref:diguanylate cyclase n=1 Tax=Shewanella eurypsychrophilus TaxID=2593656 RepID=A0ABX6V809_9GAMM|nr:MULTISPECIES: diguanylate cyclase [Shewanella]QFU22848.1 diguanylate cyclase [Shewanella sp. YLB-09]QPG58135.1 diguanylate cyclase [Shewanella eurypsychrophilus]